MPNRVAKRTTALDMGDFEKYSYLQNIINNKSTPKEEKEKAAEEMAELWNSVQVDYTTGHTTKGGGKRRKKSKRRKSKKRKTRRRKTKRRS
jgi:hypothetical protein